MGVSANFGAKVNMRKRTVRTDPDVVENVGTEWGDKRNGVSFKIWDTGDETKEVPFNKLFLRNPELFSTVVDDGVLMGVAVDSEGAGRSVEKIGKEVGYRYLCEKRYSWCGLTRFGGGRRDGSNLSVDDGQWKGGDRDVLSSNVVSRISSKDSFDKGVLSGCGEVVLLFVFTVLGLVGGDVGEDVKTDNWGGGDGGTGDDVGGAVGDVEEREVLVVIKGGPDRRGRWGILKLGGLRSGIDGLEDTGSVVKRTWVVPSVVRALEDLKDGSGGVRNVLLVDVIKGRPGGNGDVGEGGRCDDGGLGRREGHSILS